MLSLNYKEYGTGDKNMIVLHGFLGSLDNWHSLATEWSKHGLHIYTIDQRNHGRSPHTDHHSFPLMVEDLKDFMSQHQIAEAIIMGHSMGGKVAMQFALTYPELCSKLIVVDMSPRAYKPGHDDVFDAIFQVSLDTIQTRKEAEEAMTPYLGDFGTRQFILKSLERTPEGHYAWKFNLRTLFQDYTEINKAVNSSRSFEKPTLFIRGGLSLYVKDSDMNDIKTLFPGAAIHKIDDAGHWVHADKPKEFSEAILDFVNR
jgi:pimeloyl-ACP methyl ester carboxylesterase